MKKNFIALLSTLFLLTSTSLLYAQGGTQSVNLDIKGMSCGMCAAKIENNIKKLPGIVKCSVDHKAGKGTVEFDESKVSKDQILEACNKGFKCDVGS